MPTPPRSTTHPPPSHSLHASLRLMLGVSILLLAALWWTRLHALDSLPLHNDEGLHITRAVEVWNGNIFWEIRDGKIINHWLIALFYPQNAPVWMSRIPTLLVAMVGLAAGMSWGRQMGGIPGAVAVGGLWVGSSYLFFYERMAFSDAEAGALGMLALLLSLRLAAHGSRRRALWTGVALAAALLFKFSAAPFALSVALLVLGGGSAAWSRRLGYILIIAGILVLGFIPPLVFLLTRGSDLFSIALGWVGAGGVGGGLTVVENTARLLDILAGLNGGAWALWLFAGWLLALVSVRHRRLAVSALLPLLLVLTLGREAQSRHFVVALPPLVAVAGGALARQVRRMPMRLAAASGAFIAWSIVLTFSPFALQAYRDPAGLALSEVMRRQYITEHSSGYGLREAMGSFPHLLARPDIPVFASMFPDSCRRANLYAVSGRTMVCTDAPYVDRIEAALEAYGAVYVLVERPGQLGMARSSIHASITEIATFPRPGETPASASLHLWLLERLNP